MTEASTEFKKELQRRQSTTARMLRAFQKYGELDTKQLAGFGTGCSSRIHELRREGHRIVAMHDGGTNWRYIYLGSKADDDQSNVSVID